jgi:hypothetical protein
MYRLRVLIPMLSLALLVAGCAARAPAPAAAPAAPAAMEAPQEAPAAPPEPPVEAPAAAEEAGAAPAASAETLMSTEQLASAQAAGLSDILPQSQPGRKIIKNGEMTLLVDDTDRALDRMTSIVVDRGGYILSSETNIRDGFKYALVKVGVPVERFEEVQRQLRGIALKVLRDQASGQDVTDEYVDLQSRLVNLQATEARIREFLKDAKTVEEALKVNEQLTEVEGEIEQVKGRMNYLKDRSAFSTLTVELEPQVPTPTPSPTATVTPTPTPVAWRPGETVVDAANTFADVFKGAVEVAIWLLIVVAPFAIPLGLLIWYLRRRRRRKRAAAPTPESPPAAPPAGPPPQPPAA